MGSGSSLEWDVGAVAQPEHALPGDVCNRKGNKVGSLIIRPLLLRTEDADASAAEAAEAAEAAGALTWRAELSGSSDEECESPEQLVPHASPEGLVSTTVEGVADALARVEVGKPVDAGASEFELVEHPRP